MTLLPKTFPTTPTSAKSLRELVMRRGTLTCTAAEDAEADGVYKLYYDFSQPISRVLDHQILAMNRGEKRGRSQAQRHSRGQ